MLQVLGEGKGKSLSEQDVIRAWKDEEYRASLSEAERAQLPENPAGLTELSDSALDTASGGTTFRCVAKGYRFWTKNVASKVESNTWNRCCGGCTSSVSCA